MPTKYASQVKYAIRAAHRVLRPILESCEQGRAADAGFDGGEFSGPAHDRLEMDERTEALQRVGARFGLTADDLEHAMWVADNVEWDLFMEARCTPRAYR